jgi:hypothetical protein
MPWLVMSMASSGNAAAARKCLRPLQPILKQVLDSMLGALQRVPRSNQVGGCITAHARSDSCTFRQRWFDSCGWTWYFRIRGKAYNFSRTQQDSSYAHNQHAAFLQTISTSTRQITPCKLPTILSTAGTWPVHCLFSCWTPLLVVARFTVMIQSSLLHP